MIYVGSWVALIAFWFFAVRLTVKDGIKLTAPFFVLWIAAYFLFPLLGLSGGLYFISFEAVLTLILIFTDQYRSAAKSRNRNRYFVSNGKKMDYGL